MASQITSNSTFVQKFVHDNTKGNIKVPHSWWRHQMETFSALLAICAGNSPVPGEFPAQRPVTRSFDVFFDLRLNKRLIKQSRGWWFETSSWSLWRQRNVLAFLGECTDYRWIPSQRPSIAESVPFYDDNTILGRFLIHTKKIISERCQKRPQSTKTSSSNVKHTLLGPFRFSM